MREDAGFERGRVRHSSDQPIDRRQVHRRVDEHVGAPREFDEIPDGAVSPEITMDRSAASKR